MASQLFQFLDKPGTQHWAASKRVLRYLWYTSSLGLVLGGKKVVINAYSDSDYAGYPYTRQSTTGYCHFVAGGCVSWRARKQTTVATSSTKAEYRAAYEATQDVIWLCKLLSDFGYQQLNTTVLNCDNQGSIALASNPLFQAQSKHFDKKYHWVREKVTDKTVILRYIPTAMMITDFLTKSLFRPKHTFCVKASNMREFVSEGGS